MDISKIFLFTVALLCVQAPAEASLLSDLQHLQKSYPEQIQSVSEQAITWKDGTQMPAQIGDPNRSAAEKRASPTLGDQVWNVHYPQGVQNTPPQDDPGRTRYVPFFQKMYGDTQQAVQKNLVTIYWLPKLYGQKYPLQVTSINHVDKALQAVSSELEALPVTYQKYLSNPAGTFYWRVIADTNQLSMHSFGIAIDINTAYSNYWQWDLKKTGQVVSEDASLHYHNQIPWEIVKIFEKHGFIWGGKWYHYDTMHFEYRPELIK